MKLLLTLLALLTGLAGGDVARAAPTAPAVMGIAITLAEAVVEARVAKTAHRPFIVAPRWVLVSALPAPRAATAAPLLPGFTPRGLRIRE